MAPSDRLDAEYITQAEYRARRFSGAYTGTSGTLAADVLILLKERKAMTAAFDQLEADNQTLRKAVAARMEATDPADPKHRGYTPMAASLAGCKPAQEAAARCFDTTVDPVPSDAADSSDTPGIPEDWILQGHRELEGVRLRGDSLRAVTPDVPLGWKMHTLREPDEADDVSPSERLLLDAAAAVRDRRQKYGPPLQHFKITVALVNAAFGTNFRPEDWATIMQLDKIARSRGPDDHPDNDIDAAGYAACRAECRHP
jgi:hypothetical protein